MEFNYKRLKGERIARGFEPKDMAEALGISVSTYVRKEAGKVALTVKELAIIFDKLEVEDLSLFFNLKVS